jgi:hypothetical protein
MTLQTLGITRRRVLLRARFGWGRKSVPFHRGAVHLPDGYRTDGPGYASMCFGIPPDSRGGPNAVTLLTQGWMTEIDPSDLRPGDAIGYLGPDALDADGGVIVIFEKWVNDDPNTKTALTWEHLAVVGDGPDQRARPVDFRWHAYRYKHIVEED